MIDKSKIAKIYERYAPKNITLHQFEEMVEQDPTLLDTINGEFSTFDSDLAKRFKKLKIKRTYQTDKFRELLADSIDSVVMNNIAQKYAKMYEEVICSDDKILAAAWTFDTLTPEQIRGLALDITQRINKLLGFSDSLPQIQYIDGRIYPKKKSLADFIEIFMVKFVQTFFPKSDIGGYGVYNPNSAKITIPRKYNFTTFIRSLSHEYAHFIDDRHPNFGMLGEQIAKYGTRVYSMRGRERYLTNPTEISSLEIEAWVEEHIKDVLKKQADKRPEFYIKTLQSVIDNVKIKIAASKVKRVLDKYTNPDRRILRKYERLLAKYKSEHNIQYIAQEYSR